MSQDTLQRVTGMLIDHSEQWKHIHGFPLYMVSTHGRVKSCSRSYVIPHWKTSARVTKITKERIINGWVRLHAGKPVVVMVSLRRDGQTYQCRLHHLVLEAFIGCRPHGLEGCHNDGNPLNNHRDNLRWDTHKGNLSDMVTHGTVVMPPRHIGEDHPLAILTNSMARTIRSIESWPYGSIRAFARQHGITPNVVADVLKGRTWRHA